MYFIRLLEEIWWREEKITKLQKNISNELPCAEIYVNGVWDPCSKICGELKKAAGYNTYLEILMF